MYSFIFAHFDECAFKICGAHRHCRKNGANLSNHVRFQLNRTGSATITSPINYYASIIMQPSMDSGFLSRETVSHWFIAERVVVPVSGIGSMYLLGKWRKKWEFLEKSSDWKSRRGGGPIYLWRRFPLSSGESLRIYAQTACLPACPSILNWPWSEKERSREERTIFYMHERAINVNLSESLQINRISCSCVLLLCCSYVSPTGPAPCESLKLRPIP